MTIDLGAGLRQNLLSTIAKVSSAVLESAMAGRDVRLQSGQWVTDAFLWRGWVEYSLPRCPHLTSLILSVDIQALGERVSITTDIGHDDGPDLYYSEKEIQLGPRLGKEVMNSVRTTLGDPALVNALRADLDHMLANCADVET